MHTIAFPSLATLSAVYKALGSPDACAHQGKDGGWMLDVPDELTSQADALAAWPIAVSKADLIAYAADLRWQKEVGGAIVDGIPIATDDRSKLMITGARVAAMSNPDWTTVWHGADGGSYPVDAAAMVAISDAVQAHVNSGFATFAKVRVSIEAGEITTTDEVEAAFAT